MGAEPSPLLLTPEQAARRLHVSERTLRDLKKRGLIRYVAVTERIIRYRVEDCEEYLSARVRQDEPCQKPLPSPRPTIGKHRPGVVVPFSQLTGR